jgi:hypothetical protein
MLRPAREPPAGRRARKGVGGFAMNNRKTVAAAILVAGLSLGLVLWRPAAAAAQDYCEQLDDQFVDSYFDNIEFSFSGTMEDIAQDSSGSSFFVDYGCDEAYVEFAGRPGCGDGSRVTIVGRVVGFDLYDVVEARQVICLGN